MTVRGHAQLHVEVEVKGGKELAGTSIYFLGCSRMSHSMWFLSPSSQISHQPSGLDTSKAGKVGSSFWKAGEWKGKNLLESVFSGKVPGPSVSPWGAGLWVYAMF